MEFTTLGRTGLKVSVAGLGCGGGSRLGQGTGASEDHSVGIVRQALDLGVNFIDTANSYGTEKIVGKAIEGVARDSVILSTKHHAGWGGRDYSVKDILEGLETSLRRLGTDYIDIFHIHGLNIKSYDQVVGEAVPALLREKEKGKFRFLGATENAPGDPAHDMLQRAFEDDCFDVVMLAFHVMNQNANHRVFPKTQELGIGTLIMFAVRSLFSTPGRLRTDVRELVEKGLLTTEIGEVENPLGFLIHEAGAESVIDACYRYARHTAGSDVVLFGTGDAGHLKSNIASILRPPLPQNDVDKIQTLFGKLEGVGLDYPRGK